MKNLDKIAFGVAILIVFIGAGAVMFGGSDDEVAAIEEALIRIQTNKGLQKIVPTEIPDLRAEVESLHTLDEGGDFPAWTFYRAPGVVTWRDLEIQEDPEHGTAYIVVIRVERDTEKREPRLVVEVRPGKLAAASFDSIVVEARPADSTDDSAWVPAGTVDQPVSGEDSKVRVTGLRVGQPHDFRVRSKATRTSNGGTNGDMFVSEHVCDSVGPAIVPYDEFWYCSAITKASINGGTVVPGTATIHLHFWDYENGNGVDGDQSNVARHKKSGRYVEPEDFKEWEKSKPICDTDWRLYKIEETGKNPVAALRKVGSLDKRFLEKASFSKNLIAPPDVPGNCPKAASDDDDPDGDDDDL